MTIQLIHGDCLDVDWPQVDAIITDVPYGTTACKWDVIIPFPEMWAKIKRSLKQRGAFVTTASQPFTSALVMSNPKWFKYEWIWRKTKPTGFINAKNAPLKNHENILVFSDGKTSNRNNNNMIYFPQGIIKSGEVKKSKNNVYDILGTRPSRNNSGYIQENKNFPKTVIDIESFQKTIHPTQKPVALYEYLIKTYTNEGDTVLDFCFGSCTTGEACINTGRNFIGIEKDEKYYNIAKERLGL